MAVKIVTNLFIGSIGLCLVACSFKEAGQLEPNIQFAAPVHVIENLPSAFPDLTSEELQEDWAKELLIANKFARENDLYRAITSYKRALILIPSNQLYRKQQIEYDIILSYYLGEKYQEAVEAFEASSLTNISAQFLAFENLLQILHDAYSRAGQPAKAEKVFALLEKVRPKVAENLQHAEDVIHANFSALHSPCLGSNENLSYFLTTYNQHAKSVRHAKTLNALLPGAGYYYLGQKNTAITAFLVNSLFIATAYYFFDHGNWAAGAITTSLEMGWYIGGINGAGLGAKEFNEHLYKTLAKDYMIKNHLFPVLTFQTSF
jgi:tetratricopeptide (TPR) repeat protein